MINYINYIHYILILIIFSDLISYSNFNYDFINEYSIIIITKYLGFNHFEGLYL